MKEGRLWINIFFPRTVRFKDNPDGAPVFSPSDIILLNDGGRGGACRLFVSHSNNLRCLLLFPLQTLILSWRKPITVDYVEEGSGPCTKVWKASDHCLWWRFTACKAWEFQFVNDEVATHNSSNMFQLRFHTKSLIIIQSMASGETEGTPTMSSSLRMSMFSWIPMVCGCWSGTGPFGMIIHFVIFSKRASFDIFCDVCHSLFFVKVTLIDRLSFKFWNLGSTTMAPTEGMSFMVWKWCPLITLMYGSSRCGKNAIYTVSIA